MKFDVCDKSTQTDTLENQDMEIQCGSDDLNTNENEEIPRLEEQQQLVVATNYPKKKVRLSSLKLISISVGNMRIEVDFCGQMLNCRISIRICK